MVHIACPEHPNPESDQPVCPWCGAVTMLRKALTREQYAHPLANQCRIKLGRRNASLARLSFETTPPAPPLLADVFPRNAYEFPTASYFRDQLSTLGSNRGIVRFPPLHPGRRHC